MPGDVQAFSDTKKWVFPSSLAYGCIVIQPKTVENLYRRYARIRLDAFLNVHTMLKNVTDMKEAKRIVEYQIETYLKKGIENLDQRNQITVSLHKRGNNRYSESSRRTGL